MNARSTERKERAVGSSEEEANPCLLESEQAKKAYEIILHHTKAKGKVYNQNGDRCGRAAPTEFLGHNPEVTYDKPEGFLLVSRSFPCLSKDQRKIELACNAEMMAIGLVQTPEVRECFMALNNELKTTLLKKLGSKLKVVLNEHIRRQRIKSSKSGSVFCNEAADVNKVFRSEAPDVALFRKLHDAYMLPFEDGITINEVVYQTMWECGIWYASDADRVKGENYKTLNCTEKNGALKVSTIRTLARHKTREFRHLFTERKNSSHKVTLCLSKEGGRGKNERRKTQEFDRSLIKGWGGPEHIKFCEERKLPRPVPLENASERPAASISSGAAHTLIAKNRSPLPHAPTFVRSENNTVIKTTAPAQGRKTYQMQWLKVKPPGPNKLPPTVEEITGMRVKGPATKQNTRIVRKDTYDKGHWHSSPGSKEAREVQNLYHSPGWKEAEERREAKKASPVCKGLTSAMNSMSSLGQSKINEPAMQHRLGQSEINEPAMQQRLNQLEETARIAVVENRRLKKELMEKKESASDDMVAQADAHALEVAKTNKKNSKKKKESRGKDAAGKNKEKEKAPTKFNEDLDVTDIVQIHKVSSKNGEGNWVHCTLVQEKTEFVEWLPFDHVCEFCQACVEDPDLEEEENFLLLFVKDNTEAVPPDFLEAIAKKRKLTVKKLCMSLGLKKTKSPLEKVTSKGPKACGHDHCSSVNYKEVEINYKFEGDGPHCNARCRNCKRYFRTDANMAKEDFPEDLKDSIALPKSAGGRTAYACSKFEATPEIFACGNLLCCDCFLSYLNKNKRSRRDNSGQENGKGSKRAR